MSIALVDAVIGSMDSPRHVHCRLGYRCRSLPDADELVGALPTHRAENTLLSGMTAMPLAATALEALKPPNTQPFVVSAGIALVPAALLVVLGLAGAAISLRPLVTADPNSALGAAR